VPAPTVFAPLLPVVNTGDVVLSPGVYVGDITMNGGRSLTLLPGFYTFSGAISLKGGATLNVGVPGNGATMYFACGGSDNPKTVRPCAASGEAGGRIDMSANSVTNVYPPASGPYQGLVLFYDRNNTSSIGFGGGAHTNWKGSIYGSSSALVMQGNSTLVIDSLVVVSSLNANGSPNVTVNYVTADNYVYFAPRLTA
jgi:hypothetical protein